MKVWDFMGQFEYALIEQLKEDDERWGDTWRQRDVGGQEERIFAKLRDYYDQWRHGGKPIPWLKIAGLAMIAWLRTERPDVLVEEE